MTLHKLHSPAGYNTRVTILDLSTERSVDDLQIGSVSTSLTYGALAYTFSGSYLFSGSLADAIARGAPLSFEITPLSTNTVALVFASDAIYEAPPSQAGYAFRVKIEAVPALKSPPPSLPSPPPPPLSSPPPISTSPPPPTPARVWYQTSQPPPSPVFSCRKISKNIDTIPGPFTATAEARMYSYYAAPFLFYDEQVICCNLLRLIVSNADVS